MNCHSDKIKVGTILETPEKLFSERNLLMGILWEGDAQLHTNKPGMEKTPFGTTIVHGNSVASIAIGQLFHTFLGEASKIRIIEMNVNFVGSVSVGDFIKGVFTIEGQQIRQNNSETLTMIFDIFKNKQTVVHKGKMSIEIEWIK